MSSRAMLLDENLSFRLVQALEQQFPGIAHVSQFNRLGMPDIEIWRFAREQQYCIVTMDSDFNQLAFVHGTPPQVIWLRLGDATTAEVAECLMSHKGSIDRFLSQDTTAVLEIP